VAQSLPARLELGKPSRGAGDGQLEHGTGALTTYVAAAALVAPELAKRYPLLSLEPTRACGLLRRAQQQTRELVQPEARRCGSGRPRP
jgi:hypothetical protein